MPLQVLRLDNCDLGDSVVAAAGPLPALPLRELGLHNSCLDAPACDALADFIRCGGVSRGESINFRPDG